MKRLSTYIAFTAMSILCSGSGSHAQDLAADMKFMYDVLKNPTSLHVVVEALIITDDDNGGLEQSREHTEIKIKNGKYMCIGKDFDMLINDKHIVMVQKNTQEILYSRNDGAYVKKQQSDMSTLPYMAKPEVNDDIIYHGIKDGFKHYTIINSKGVIKKGDLWFDAETGFLKKTEYEYTPESSLGGSRAISEFKIINPKAELNDSDFSETIYVDLTGNVVKPATRYKLFKLTHIEI